VGELQELKDAFQCSVNHVGFLFLHFRQKLLYKSQFLDYNNRITNGNNAMASADEKTTPKEPIL
jgi:hypothetical protein